MRVFRIERERYLDTTLKGIGAAKSKGFRWNSINSHLVYTSESRALAVLEISVHLDVSEDLPSDRYIVEIDIPDSIQIAELKLLDLPANWDAKPPILDTQRIGDDFIDQNDTAVLKVPSSIVPEELNFLINPLHSEASQISVVSTKPFNFDSRLRKQGQ